MSSVYPRIGGHKTVAAFQQHLASLQLSLPVAERPLSAAEGSVMAGPLTVESRTIGNRWCVHPMEGWDGETDGRPTAPMRRRWRNFGASGCKLIWGCEAFAIRPDGRANPRQLLHRPDDIEPLRAMLDGLKQQHADSFGAGADSDLLVGLQLTHSGRFCKPNRNDHFEPRIAYRHPVLDARVGLGPGDDHAVLRDDEIPGLIAAYVSAARTAQTVGFDFVDIKACHGYLMHEFLSGFTRPGPYGGDFEGRTRLLHEVIAAVRAECPGLIIGVRLSVFDHPAFRPAPGEGTARKKGRGVPEAYTVDRYPAFGARADDPLAIDLTEPIALLKRLRDDHGVRLFNLTAGSPYYNPHFQRPAFYPPSDGYQPPEDPLVGCVRQIEAVRQVKEALPDVVLVGTAYSYFQEYLPHVAEAVVQAGWVDSVGIGRLVLSDWTLPAKVLRGEDYAADKKICRTFSDCTTAPRNGIISGCYPLDDFYKNRPEFELLKKAKAGS